MRQEREIGGQLGRPSGARHRTYMRLRDHAERIRGTFDEARCVPAIDDIYRLPLLQSASDTLNRQLRAGIDDAELGGPRDETARRGPAVQWRAPRPKPASRASSARSACFADGGDA